MSQSSCTRCKGKGMCGRPTCPILARFRSIESTSSRISATDSLFGASPPAVFVGRHGYPKINAGPMIPPLVTGSDAMGLEDPKKWLNMEIGDIISARSQLVRANTSVDVKDAMSHDNRLLSRSQELALSKDPVDAEAWFSKPIKNDLKFDSVLTPMGPSGLLENFKIAENPKVPKKVDYLVYDTDALAKDAVSELLKGDIPVHHVSRLLSIGLLGQKRSLVPTRWSITAVDDMAGKDILSNMRDYPQVSEVTLYSGGIFGNHFEILLIPRNISFELIEIWLPRAVWSGDSTWIGSDHEGMDGKKGYSNLAGGYYAARLGILEHLNSLRRQASIFMVREIRPDYWAPLGVWVVREAVRHALEQKPQKFDSIEAALSDMSKRLQTPKADWIKSAKLLSDMRFQKTLDSFF